MAMIRNDAPDAAPAPGQIAHAFELVFERGRPPQLTVRAAVMGMLLGMVMAVSNLYLGLKTGSAIAATITSCMLAYAAFAALHRLAPRLFPRFSILENNAMQSCATAASLMAISGMTSAIPALMMIEPRALPAAHWQLALWIGAVSMLGVFLAIPAKRQMLDAEQLPFPDGVAAAALMRSLHGDRAAAARQTRSLGIAGGGAAVLTWFRDAAWSGMPYANVPAYWGTSWLRIGGYAAPQLTVMLEGSTLFIAFGALISFTQAWSLLLGAIVNYVVLAPMMLDRHVIARASYPSIVGWSLWIGVPMLVTSSIVALALEWRTGARALSRVAESFRGPRGGTTGAREVPLSWFAVGFVTFGTTTIVLGETLFHIAWGMGLLAVIGCFPLVLVAARAVGETAQNPQGALSKITQFGFGALAPTSSATNLMTANVTAGTTAHAADLLADLKSGQILGADPRQQLFAQMLGVVAGALVVVPAFFVLVPDASQLGTARWPAPSAIVWRGVAELVGHGLGALDPTARMGLAAGAAIGVLLPILRSKLPRYRAFVPSATGLGIAFTIPAFACISIFIGGLIALAVASTRPAVAEEYTVPVASGLIAGESLMGVLIALLTIKGWLG